MFSIFPLLIVILFSMLMYVHNIMSMYYVAVFCPHHSTTTTTIETLDGGFNSSMYLLFYRYKKQTSSQKEKSLCNNANSMLIFSKTLIYTSQDNSCVLFQ